MNMTYEEKRTKAVKAAWLPRKGIENHNHRSRR